ncbi:MAG TPA: branched-chain alpha-keto acid dehydrogenase subunit E2 [Dehalococcoidia bacterium]|nr:branched-chain alpha-keto acid dehydrogenase subunit E2 [Dehalococcoidia bacterium]
MHTMRIELPQVGESVTEGVIGKWLKQIGDQVDKYDPLVEVVTDKVNMEMPSPESGVLTAILADEGATVPMGTVIAEIQVDGEESVPADPPAIGRTGELLKNVAPVGPTGSGTPVPIPEPPRAEVASSRKRHSPAVLRLAQEHSVDLAQVTGTGINGRITRKDVQSVIDAGPAAPAPTMPAAADEERVPLTPVRRMIADHMIRSASEIPQAWTIVEANVSGLVARRAVAKTDFEAREGINITYLPFVIKAVAESLKENPLLNSSWGGDAVILKNRINIGIAADTSDGLVVPVIHDADAMSIVALAHKVHDLTTRARQGELRLEDVQGGTFTLNNTGALGSIASQPLVNHPQAAILTTEAIVKRAIVVDDAIAIRPMMNLCMSFDHRIMDGAEASAFINAVRRRVEAIGPDTPVY